MSIATKVLKNSSANVISFIWNSILFFLITPIMISKLGTSGFGIIALTATLTGFAGFLDLGFTGAAVKQIAESYARRDYKRINEVVSISMVIYGIMGCVAGIALVILINSPLISYFKIDAGGMGDLMFSLYIASINIIINLILGVYSNIPYALQKNIIQAKCNIFLGTITNILIALFLYLGFGLKTVMVLKLMSSIAALLIYYIISKKLVSNLKLRFYYNAALFKEMFSFSFYNLITQISQPFFGQFDRILLGSMVNVSVITYYVVPVSVGTKIQSVMASITNVIFPLTSELSAGGKEEKIKYLYFKALKIVTFITLMIIIPLYIYSKGILSLWMGAEFADKSNGVFRVVLGTFMLLSTNTVCYFMFNGLNKPKVNAVYTLISSVIKIAFCLILIPSHGAFGAAVAFLISALPIPLFILYFERVMGIRKLFFVFKVYIPSFAIGVFTIIVFSLINYTGTNIVVLGALSFASSICFAILSFVIRYFEKDDIERFKYYLSKVLNAISTLSKKKERTE